MTSNPFTCRHATLITILWLTSGASQPLLAKECDESIATALSIQGQVERYAENGKAWRPIRLNEVFCAGDRIRVGSNSRASLKLNNETLLRLAENSSVRINKPARDSTTSLGLLKGIAHFISRVKHRFQVNTPYINAGIEGTEFTVEVASDHAVVSVLEGQVRANNAWGEVLLKGGQKAVAYPGVAPQIEQVIDPLDAVQWSLFYPPMSDEVFRNGSAAGQRSFQAYRRGDTEGAFSALTQASGIERDALLLVYRASLHIRVGGVEAARRDLLNALRLQPEQADALALLSIIETVQNQRQQALELAQRAVAANPRGLAPLLALSYARQAHFQLSKALEAAQQATKAAPDSVLAWTQQARLHLMFHQLDEADDALRRAVAIAPGHSQTKTLLGFIHLARLDFDNARQAFDQAIDLDTAAAPLPRLGLGLLEIRQGHLAEGRRQLEIATNLDPGNAMIRSYLGKAYYEEKREQEAATQFALAKQLDELDPTAWFYNAILLRSQNRPIEALDEMQTAIDLNDNRAVYRSRYLLDQDEAARMAGLARIYSDLGYGYFANIEAYKSLQTSAANYSAHRLLADSYSHSWTYHKAQNSELLQSQLLQPLNRHPLQPQIGFHVTGLLDNTGPIASGFSEYAPLFTSSNGLDLQLNTIGGSHGTQGNDLILSGLHDRIAFSLAQSHYKSDGVWETEPKKRHDYDAFLQVALTPSTSLQLEHNHEDNEQSNGILTFDSEHFTDSEDHSLNSRLTRIGFHHQFDTNGHLLVSLINQEITSEDESVELQYIPNYPTPSGVFPAIAEYLLTSTRHSEAYTLEFQHIQPFHEHTFILGGGRFADDITNSSALQGRLILLLSEPPFSYPYSSDSSPTFSLNYDPVSFENIYLYTQLALPARINLTLGLTHEKIEEGPLISTSQTSPKFGLTWEILKDTTFRTAYSESLSRPGHMKQTIEPTHAAGFNQLIQFPGGTETKQFGFGIDTKLSRTLNIGAEFTRSDHQRPTYVINPSSYEYESVFYEGLDLESFLTYLHWRATTQLDIFVGYYKTTQDIPGDVYSQKKSMFATHYFWPSGMYLLANGYYVDKELTLKGVNLPDNGWNIDAGIGYRFPKRYGRAEVIVRNLLDKELDSGTLPFPPKREVFARLTINF
jgi:tetratricopeptide (TPR) repeat protein